MGLMRYVAIDLGDKRTGLAVGDSVTRLVTPLAVLESPIAVRGGEQLLEDLARAIEEQLGKSEAARERESGSGAGGWGAAVGGGGELVVGLPLNMDGTEGPRAKMVREFAARLEKKTTRVVRFQDERLTSAQADWGMARSGMTRGEKKSRRDALAAGVVLRDFLESLPRGA
jgi:putative Holliday junction resolvase